ncbi:hypothetical protein CSUI_002123 [Cystoisospora suis]|uniref:Uncharacterized protein n=1 Tax=Cystoisospora suis TaxID=483139 RepID=A0A2C6KV30_9APIC|nr:hypothetical protein CSUI_002123 [Cystoisospora suis]
MIKTKKISCRSTYVHIYTDRQVDVGVKLLLSVAESDRGCMYRCLSLDLHLFVNMLLRCVGDRECVCVYDVDLFSPVSIEKGKE